MKYKEKKIALTTIKSLLVFAVLLATYTGINNLNKESIISEVKGQEFKINDFDFFKVKNLEETIEAKTGLDFVFKDGYLTISDLTGYEEILSKEYIVEVSENKNLHGRRASETYIGFINDDVIENYESAFFKKDNNLLRLDVSNNPTSKHKYIVREVRINDISKEDAKKITSTGNIKYSDYIDGVDYVYLSGEQQKLIYKVSQLESISYYKAIETSNDFYEMKYKLKPYENIINTIIQTLLFIYFTLEIPTIFNQRKGLKGLISPKLKIFNRKTKKENELYLKELIKETSLNKKPKENKKEIKQRIKIENE